MNDLFDFQARPQAAWLTTNRQCDARCPHCYAKGTRYNPSDDMTLETASSILSLLNSMDIKLVTVLGGEPLMWEPLVEYNRIAKSYGMESRMATNAFRFGDDDFWMKYMEQPCNLIGVSIKGVGAEMLKRLANVNDHERAERGVRRALDCYKNGVSTVFSSLMSPDDLWGIAKTTREWGAKTISIGFACATLDSHGKASSKNYMIDPNNFKAFIEVYDRIDELFDGGVVFEPQLPFCMFDADFIDKLIDKAQLSNGCFVNSRGGFTLDKNGNVLVCNSIYHEPIARIGQDFTDGESLMRRLNDESVKDIFKDLTRYPSDVCLGCDYKRYCRGGCLVNWTVLKPDMVKPVIRGV